MHCISTESSDINPMIVKYMPIKPIIMPNLLILLTFKIILKMINESCILSKVIYEHSWSIAEIVLRARKKWGSNNSTFSNWSLIFNVQIYGLSIPCNDSFSFHQFFNTIKTLISVCDDSSAWNDLKSVVFFQWVFDLFKLFVSWFKLFNRKVFEFSSINLVKPIMRWSTHSICNTKEFILWRCNISWSLTKKIFCVVFIKS